MNKNIRLVSKIALALFLTLGLAACSGLRGPSYTFSPGLSERNAAAVDEIEQEILQADADLDVARNGHPKIPIEINEAVQKWIHFFTVTDRDRFERFLARGSMYKNTVQKILKENGVPPELYYLAMVESGYMTNARSRAKAVGAWQFIRGTGLRYGLKQNRYLDERRDIIRSTKAAAIYLSGLHTAFQSWYLAMASYNAGEGRILGAVVKGNSRNFWDLVDRKALPPETRNYVPKILAAIIIGKHPQRYGFKNFEESPFPEVEIAHVPGGVRLRDIANRSDLSLTQLRFLNPHLIRQITPANMKTYDIWVPAGQAKEIEGMRSKFARVRHVVRHRRIARKVHRVRRGEALSLISDRYGVPLAKIKRANDLRSNRIYAGQSLVIPSI
ncbi:MAG: transglycosylase SLT domain-containing protein [Bacteriovoracia bacterium]